MLRTATRTNFRAAVGLALAAALVFACGAPPPAPMGEWAASVSTAGGVTGGGATTVVRADGSAYSEAWEVVGGELTRRELGTVPEKDLHDLRDALLAPELHKTPRGQPANMTTTLAFTADGAEHVWYFEYLSEPPAPVERAIAAFEAAVRAAR